ncbi:type II toxin-antitoxin system PemK/MazF family toxin [Dyadobacter bucti]|uniref:type II toxin-antitoxin system PemK/MazF family toxin n=1 Tax=Dyadobacter bucti TaxID=2572203 RepID=UPI003F728483
MPFEKGDIISLNFEMPDTGDFIEHPGVVISCLDVYNHDRCYICVMMTSNDADDQFTFRLNDAMLERPNSKSTSQVRCHLITYVREIHINSNLGRPFNRLKRQALERLMAHINTNVFDY